MSVTSQQVVAAARGWLGTRWQHQASVKGVACDCVGLVAGVARELGLLHADLPPYERTADGATLTRLCAQHMRGVPLPSLQPGHVAVLRFEAYPTHLAVVGDYAHGGLSLIHASAPARRVIEHRLDDVWWFRLVTGFELPGVEYV